MTKQDLFYYPKLGYEKNYYTVGKLKKINKTRKQEQTDFKLNDNIEELNNNINSLLGIIPEDIVNVYLSPFYGMKAEYNYIIDEYNNGFYDAPPDKDTDKDNTPDDIPNKGTNKYTPDDNNNNHNRIPIFDRQYDVDLTKGEPVVDPVYTIKRDYYFYFLYIYEDYLLNAYNSLQNYVMSCLNNIVLGKLNDPVPEATSKAIKNKNLLHLTDYLTKSNINLEQTLRLHKKMFHLDETIYHLKSIRVSREQSLRYAAIKPKEVKSSQDIENNNILKESLDISQKKYEENLYGLYKYLNSSVILLDESLKTMLKQNKALNIINKDEER